MKNKHPFWMKLDWRGARPLTLRELIMKSNFEIMMKYIIAFDKKMTNQASHFYRACECIRDMKVKYDERYFLAENNDGAPFIMALEGSFWHHCLGSPVIRAKGLRCSDTQLAAQCLWHLTFYGYTPKEQKEKFDRENEELEKEMRNDELCLCDDIYTDEEIKEFALSGLSKVRDEVLERLFTPEEIVEIKRIRKEKLDEENARYDAAEAEERQQLEQEAALKMELRKKAEQEKREKWYRKRRQSRWKNRRKKRR